LLDHHLLTPLGVVVTGIDVDTLTDDTVAALRTLLAEHGVIVLPGQHVDDERFLRFLQSFGPTMFTEGEVPVPGFEALNVITNVGRSTPPRSNFHTDTSYVRNPPAYTALRAVEVPVHGGRTLFTDQYAAYDSLPVDVRDRLAGRTVTHVVTGVDLDEHQESSAEHPLFTVHPRSGRTALYLSTSKRCSAISGLAESEAADTIGQLLAHSTREDNVLAHRWSPGDVVMWDNRCVMHRADHDGVVGDRVMHRGMVVDIMVADALVGVQ
jgi:taurine dioxygenase